MSPAPTPDLRPQAERDAETIRFLRAQVKYWRSLCGQQQREIKALQLERLSAAVNVSRCLDAALQPEGKQP